MSITKKRLTPEESRTAALDAARDILIEAGPQAVTLKAVAGRIGRTHANLLHHFGSASGLQRELARTLAENVCATIGETVMKARAGEEDPRRIVDMTFDAFDKGGAGALASWMILTGNEDALNPIVEAIHNLVDQLGEGHNEESVPLHQETLQLVLMALGDALLGGPLAKSLGLPRETAREMATGQLDATRENYGFANDR
ncbi:TetR/AcrR family transcriptional regulator [Parasphingopyxis marina]|uniref:TetR/AcrR family transcriptional regulator n=1 Tax=Parasphingopyxis marina TaxID=2761622 RepID=A0A842HYL3_9SPHN|nr:TetR/AcrR family transcriptional regulator [Parasphingopyxis marina]MBC2777010.1 TetR/AcrR family transcriptional regulator [Parasphingopyxis marina]